MLNDQFLNKILEIDAWRSQSDDDIIRERLITRIDEIMQCVFDGCKPIAPETNETLQVMLTSFLLNLKVLKVFLSNI